MTVADCLFERNYAFMGCGALLLEESTDTETKHMDISRSRFLHNSSPNWSGALQVRAPARLVLGFTSFRV